MTSNFKAWLHGLGASTIQAAAGALGGMVTLPTVFNFSHDGLLNVAKVMTVPAILAAAGYLKQSPLPASAVTVTTTETVSATKE